MNSNRFPRNALTALSTAETANLLLLAATTATWSGDAAVVVAVAVEKNSLPSSAQCPCTQRYLRYSVVVVGVAVVVAVLIT